MVWDDIVRVDSSESSVSKFVYTKRGAVAEAVLYRWPDAATRTVICCSTQSGCPVGCRFCGAGDRFVRSLSADEIVGQVTHILEGEIDCSPSEVGRLQVMFMSMGEPMLNQKHVFEAVRRLHVLYPHAALLLSSSGPDVGWDGLFELSREIEQVGLQFSVHESTDEARDRLIPFRRKLDLAGVARVGEQWARVTGRRPFFNYCVHGGNCSAGDVERLRGLFDPSVWEVTVSVICERDESLRAAHERQRELTEGFMGLLVGAGFSVRRFDPAGQDDIGGGCGQLFFVQDWFKRHPELGRWSAGAGLPIVHAG